MADNYSSPAALRAALTEKLRSLAGHGVWTLAELQRQFAYDRLLERLYRSDDQWIVKGATALLARQIGVRATVDVDLYRAETRDAAERSFRLAVSADLGDGFTFEIQPGRPVADGVAGIRLPATAVIGPTVWSRFHVDLVGADVRMTGDPDRVPPLARVTLAAVEQHGYRAYPLADHVADKVFAVLQRHGVRQVPSTRYKDLVDLVAISSRVDLVAVHLRAALNSEAGRRGFTLPTSFDVPDRTLWERGYAAEARRSRSRASLTVLPSSLDGALALVVPFLDPILAGEPVAIWRAQNGTWDR